MMHYAPSTFQEAREPGCKVRRVCLQGTHFLMNYSASWFSTQMVWKASPLFSLTLAPGKGVQTEAKANLQGAGGTGCVCPLHGELPPVHTPTVHTASRRCGRRCREMDRHQAQAQPPGVVRLLPGTSSRARQAEERLQVLCETPRLSEGPALCGCVLSALPSPFAWFGPWVVTVTQQSPRFTLWPRCCH